MEMYIALCLKVISIIYLNVLQSHYYKNTVLKIMRNMRLPPFISIIKGHIEQISCERTWVEHWPKHCNKPLKATFIHSADTTEQ